MRETKDGCDPCPGPFGGPRNRTAEAGGSGGARRNGGGSTGARKGGSSAPRKAAYMHEAEGYGKRSSKFLTVIDLA